MRDKVYLLWFVKEQAETDETELLVGVYESQDEADAAVLRLRDQPGFSDFPQGFKSVAYELNKDHWTKGFVRVS
jgi:homoserine kinase type II